MQNDKTLCYTSFCMVSKNIDQLKGLIENFGREWVSVRGVVYVKSVRRLGV